MVPIVSTGVSDARSLSATRRLAAISTHLASSTPLLSTLVTSSSSAASPSSSTIISSSSSSSALSSAPSSSSSIASDNTSKLHAMQDRPPKGGKPHVLLCGQIVWSWKEIDALRSKFEFLELDVNSREEFREACKPGNKFGAIQAIYRHNNSAEKIGVFDSELISCLPDSCRFLCHNGAGYDQIDVDACTRRNIQVSNTPGAVDDATATVAMYLVISALRGFSLAEHHARAGKFKDGLKPGHDPEFKTLGIVGMGGIGRALARRALGFSMRIVYHNRHRLPPSSLVLPATEYSPGIDLSPWVTYVDTLDALLAQSDVVSLNLPLNEQTRKSFGHEQFGKMKPGAVLINTARGGVVDEEAMLAALASGQLSAAGLDVFPDEPMIEERLRADPRVALLPHMGTETEEAQHGMELRVLHHNIVPALEGAPLGDPVWEQRRA